MPKDAAIVEAVGRQWNWSFRFPGEDGELGATSAKLTTPDNPFGIDPDDPKGQDDVLVPGQELHLPIGKPVKMLLRSTDVLHDFTVPAVPREDGPRAGHGHPPVAHADQGRHLRDPVRGALRPGALRHARQGGRGRSRRRSTPGSPARPRSRTRWHGRRAIPRRARPRYATCMACHGAQGEGNQLLNAPKLAGQPGWYLARQLRQLQARHPRRQQRATRSASRWWVSRACWTTRPRVT